MQSKYNLAEVSKEESEVFMKEFQALLDQHSMYFEPVPQYVRDGIVQENGSPYPWRLTFQILLQKRVAITEPEVVKDIPSPFSNEITPEA